MREMPTKEHWSAWDSFFAASLGAGGKTAAEAAKVADKAMEERKKRLVDETKPEGE